MRPGSESPRCPLSGRGGGGLSSAPGSEAERDGKAGGAKSRCVFREEVYGEGVADYKAPLQKQHRLRVLKDQNTELKMSPPGGIRVLKLGACNGFSKHPAHISVQEQSNYEFVKIKKKTEKIRTSPFQNAV